MTNFAGINRVAWDLREDGPVRWEGAAKDEYKGPRTGPQVVPGRYTVRIALGGRTFSRAAARSSPTRARTRRRGLPRGATPSPSAMPPSSRRSTRRSTGSTPTPPRPRSARQGAAPELAAALRDVRAKALALRGRLTADFTNDEDSIAHGRGACAKSSRASPAAASSPPARRPTPPSASTRRASTRRTRRLMRDVAAFERGDVARANAALRAAGKPALATSGAKRADVVGGESAAEDE